MSKHTLYAIAFGFLILFTANTAAADPIGLFVEPGVTYEAGSTSVNYSSPLSDSSGTANGLGLSARLGVHFLDVVFAGLDGRYSMPRFKDPSYNANATAYNWGPVVGIQTPVVGLRVWAGYIWGGEFNPEASGNLDVKFSGASGYRIGAGFRVAVVSLNLEYQQIKYDRTTLEQLGPFSASTSTSDVSLHDNAWILGVSFPIDL